MISKWHKEKNLKLHVRNFEFNNTILSRHIFHKTTNHYLPYCPKLRKQLY